MGNLHIGLAALGASLAVGIIGMKASDAVGRAIIRLQKRLTKAVQTDGTPDRTVRSFGVFIYKRILRPSGRARRPGGVKLSAGTGGFFRYVKKA